MFQSWVGNLVDDPHVITEKSIYLKRCVRNFCRVLSVYTNHQLHYSSREPMKLYFSNVFNSTRKISLNVSFTVGESATFTYWHIHAK